MMSAEVLLKACAFLLCFINISCFPTHYGRFAALISVTVGALTRVNCITIVLPSSVMVIVAVLPVMIKGTESSALVSIPLAKTYGFSHSAS